MTNGKWKIEMALPSESRTTNSRVYAMSSDLQFSKQSPSPIRGVEPVQIAHNFAKLPGAWVIHVHSSTGNCKYWHPVLVGYRYVFILRLWVGCVWMGVHDCNRCRVPAKRELSVLIGCAHLLGAVAAIGHFQDQHHAFLRQSAVARVPPRLAKSFDHLPVDL